MLLYLEMLIIYLILSKYHLYNYLILCLLFLIQHYLRYQVLDKIHYRFWMTISFQRMKKYYDYTPKVSVFLVSCHSQSPFPPKVNCFKPAFPQRTSRWLASRTLAIFDRHLQAPLLSPSNTSCRCEQVKWITLRRRHDRVNQRHFPILVVR